MKMKIFQRVRTPSIPGQYIAPGTGKISIDRKISMRSPVANFILMNAPNAPRASPSATWGTLPAKVCVNDFS